MTKFLWGLVSVALLLGGCARPPQEKVTIAINPWPGYEYLYLADIKGFFNQVGAPIKLVELSSLADAQRSYLNGHADGFASTMIEAVQAQAVGKRPLKVVMITDYSDGGDVIQARKAISSVADLKGKTIGCEVTSLGIFMLFKALEKHGLSLDDVTVLNIEQANGEQAMLDGKIDAYISYPPVSVNIAKHKQFHQIFSSADIPNQIIDTVAISTSVLDQHPKLVSQLLKAWQLALDYASQHPEEALQIMAQREGLSLEDFESVLGDLKIHDSAAQKALLTDKSFIASAARDVCQALVKVNAFSADCQTLPSLVYDGDI